MFSEFPRVSLAQLPTPLQPLPRLSAALGGKTQVWIKRDDCTGLGGGGNKTRKLEFLLGSALAQQADAVITHGAVQSNHVRQTAAAAAKLGLACYALLEERLEAAGGADAQTQTNGNVLLDKLFKARLSRFAAGTDMNAEMEKLAQRLRADGTAKNPYIIPGGGSCAVGALGYANAARELIVQADERQLRFDCIVHASGSAGTQAGLAAGLAALGSAAEKIELLGISVRAEAAAQEKTVLTLARQTAALMGLPAAAVTAQQVRVNSDFTGDGYGLPAASTFEAIALAAELEGILLDPVYSGKGMAGLIGLARDGYFAECANIVFIHTGGAQALAGYVNFFNDF